MKFKKGLAIMCAAAMGISAFTFGSGINEAEAATVVKENTATAKPAVTKAPKYVFMFIGDGMSYPQIQLTNYYLSALKDTNNNDIVESKKKI